MQNMHVLGRAAPLTMYINFNVVFILFSYQSFGPSGIVGADKSRLSAQSALWSVVALSIYSHEQTQ